MELATSEERVQLLKLGIFGQEIEQLYIIRNDFRIINGILHEN